MAYFRNITPVDAKPYEPGMEDTFIGSYPVINTFRGPIKILHPSDVIIKTSYGSKIVLSKEEFEASYYSDGGMFKPENAAEIEYLRHTLIRVRKELEKHKKLNKNQIEDITQRIKFALLKIKEFENDEAVS